LRRVSAALTGKKAMSLRQRNGKWVWDFYPNGRNGKRVRSTLPASITTKEQAEKHISQLRNDVRSNYGVIQKNAADKIIWLSEAKIEALIDSALKTLKPVTTDKSYRDLNKLSQNIVRFLIEKKIPYFQIVNPTPSLIMEFIAYRECVASKNTINRELYAFKKLHEGLVYLGHAEPLSFEISRLYLKEKRDSKSFSEKFFEVLIEKHPKHFLGEDLVFIETPSQIQRLIPDSLFASKDGAYVVLEIQKGALDRNHTYKLLDYRDKVESRLSQPGKPVVVRMMVVVIGDDCTIERKLFLEKYKIELKLLPLVEIEKRF
jgi:hypothetical protein